MKSPIKALIFIVVITSFLMSCTTQNNTQPTTQPTTNTDTTDTATGYPIEQNSTTNFAYPAPGNQVTEQPAYQQPGFITATPDPSISKIIVSEVRHEDGAEIIVIKNISPSDFDISAYMLFSPALSERIILPTSLILTPGETFEVYNGDTSGRPTEQSWLDQTILNVALDEVILVNASGRIVYQFVYYPAVTP